MPVCRYIDEIGLVAMLPAKMSVGNTPEMNLREYVTCMPLHIFFKKMSGDK